MSRAASPRFPNVRNAYIGSVGAVLVAAVYNRVVDGNPDLWDPLAVGVAAFLGWAIAREVDPDHPWTALIALVGSALLAMWLPPQLLVSAVALAAMRLVAGTVSAGPPTKLDLAAMVVASGLAGWYIDGWGLAAAIAVGVLVAGGWRSAPWAIGAGVTALVSGLLSATRIHPGDESFRLVTLPFLVVVVIVMALPVRPRSLTDIGKMPLDGQRLRLARALGALSLCWAVLGSGVHGLSNLGPLTAAILATALIMPSAVRSRIP